jgi:hypothetical protein
MKLLGNGLHLHHHSPRGSPHHAPDEGGFPQDGTGGALTVSAAASSFCVFSVLARRQRCVMHSLTVTGKRTMRGLIGILALAAAAPASAANYVVITLHADVSAPVDSAWAKVGGFCDIAKWANLPCKLSSGTGEVGSVRSLAGGAVEEPMIAATAHSYTYGQTLGDNKDIYYHGTLAIEPTGTATSRVDYTLTYDQERVPADQREAMRDQMTQRFRAAVENIKKMAEAR